MPDVIRWNGREVELRPYKLCGYYAQHPLNARRVMDMVRSIGASGWQGPPIVLLNSALFTGHHRAAACELLGIEPPTIEVREVYAEVGLSFNLLFDLAEEDPAALMLKTPEALREKYGLDWR